MVYPYVAFVIPLFPVLLVTAVAIEGQGVGRAPSQLAEGTGSVRSVAGATQGGWRHTGGNGHRGHRGDRVGANAGKVEA